jgi:hydrogenase maturation protease
MCSVSTTSAKVLVLCLGNDIRSDDGVGWAVADELGDWGLRTGGWERSRGARTPESRQAAEGEGVASPILSPQSPVATVKRSALSGFYLLDELIGYDRVIVVDAVKTGAHPPGTVLSFPFEALGTETGPSPHAVGLPSVVALGRQSGVPLPTEIHIVAIEVDDMESIAEGLTPLVRAAVPRAVARVRSLLAPGLT